MNNKTWVVVIAIIIILAGVWYYKTQVSGPATGETIKIGGIFALTGAGASIGEEELKGAQLAVNEVNETGGVAGRPLELIVEDVSIDKIKVAGAVAQKLVSIDRVAAIVGPQWDEPAFAILPIIEEAKVPMVGPDNTDDLESENNYDYFFSTWYDNRVGIDELLKFAQSKKYHRIAIMRPLSAGFWQFASNDFSKKAADYDVEIVADIDLGNPLLTDFRTPLTKIKLSRPEAIFMVVSDTNQCIVLRQMKELGLNIPLLATEAAGNSSSLKQCPKEMENLYFSTPISSSGQYDSFVRKFEKAYGYKPEFPSSVTAYDAVRVIARGLEETDGAAGELLRLKISGVKMAGAALPNISFNNKGFLVTPEGSFQMRTVLNGKFIKI